MAAPLYISEEELLQWYQLCKKRKFYGQAVLKFEAGELYLVEEQRKFQKKELIAEIEKKK